MHAGLHVEIEGARLEVTLEGEVPYVRLGAFAAARFLEFEYSYIDDIYLLRSPREDGGLRILSFRPGDQQVTVDDTPVPLSAPPIAAPDGLLVPLYDFSRLVLGREAAAAIQVRPDEGPTAQLLEISPVVRPGLVKLVFQFDGLPEAEIRHLPDRSEVEVVFAGAAPGRTSAPMELADGGPARAVHLVADSELLQLRAVIELTGPAVPEGFFVATSRQYILTLRASRGGEDLSYTVAETVSGKDRAFLAAQSLGLDASHGGRDPGAQSLGDRAEKGFVLTVAEEVRALASKTGLPTSLVRRDDRLLPMMDRVHHGNRERFSALVSLHARSQQPTSVSSAPVIFVLPLEADTRPAAPAPPPPAAMPDGELPFESGDASWTSAPTPAPSPAVRAIDPEVLRQPSAQERAEGHRLAEALARSFARNLGFEAPILEDPGLMPAARTLAPAVAVDLGPLEAFLPPSDPGFDRDPERRRLVFACYQGVLDYYRDRRARAPGGVRVSTRTVVTSPPGPGTPDGSGAREHEGLRRDILGVDPGLTDADWRPSP
jgi:N-acetylmuramoyl-L-alanine amidase